MATLKLTNRVRNALCHALLGTPVGHGREITTEDLAKIDCVSLIRMKGVGRLSFDDVLDALWEAGGRLECGCPSGCEGMSTEQRLEHEREARDRCEQRRIVAERTAERERDEGFRQFIESVETGLRSPV